LDFIHRLVSQKIEVGSFVATGVWLASRVYVVCAPR
jgi:hypothetical protein